VQREQQAAISHRRKPRCRRELVNQIDISDKQATIDCYPRLTELSKGQSRVRGTLNAIARNEVSCESARAEGVTL